MFDIKSAKVTGAVETGRARVVWQDGILNGYKLEGDYINHIFSIQSDEPKRRPRYIRAWDANTEQGVIHIDEACWTCNGWLKMAMKSINELTGAK